MAKTGIRIDALAPTRSDVKFCRVAALGGVWGAVLVAAAPLAAYSFFIVEGSIDRISLALVASAVAAGIALMVIGARSSARLHSPPGAAYRPPVLRDPEDAAGAAATDRRSLA